MTRRLPAGATPLERFTRFVDRSGGPDVCWPYMGFRGWRGYGRFNPHSGPERVPVLAHRYAYVLWVGPIPTGLFVCHHCDNPPCVNPVHLFIGTNTDNVRDMGSKGRRVQGARRTGVAHHNARLDPDAIREIRAAYPGVRVNALARQFGVHHKTITRVLQGKTWANVAEANMAPG